MTVLLHLANLLFLGAYLVKDVITLRILSIIGGLCSTGYFVWAGLWTPIFWNVIFVTINVWFVYRRKANV